MGRKTYIENNSFNEAVGSYLENFSTLESEIVKTENANGRVLSKAVIAKKCDPGFNAAAMDGIAVFAEKTIGASDQNPISLKLNVDFEYINTGNLVKEQFDSVIMIEDVIIEDYDNVKIVSPSHPWQHVRIIGESVVATEMVLPSFSVIRPIDIGAILASGNDFVEVIRQPRVGIIPTGSEMVDSAEELKVSKLRESNTRVFAPLTVQYGGLPKRYEIVGDSEENLLSAIKLAAKENDIVVINAGSSAGTKDYTLNTIEKLGKIYTHGLAIKPGKPTILAEIQGKPVIGVPGYPVSAYIVYERVVQQVIKKLLGIEVDALDVINVEMTKRVTSALKNEEFIRVAIGDVDGKIIATPLGRGAAQVMSMVKADGIVKVPNNSEGIEAGEIVEAELLKPFSSIKKSLVIVGSHDMIIDIIGDKMLVSSAHVGSLSGIMALKNKAANIAPIHLLDEETGKYNISYVQKYFKPNTMALIKGVGRVQGILVEKGNPKNITTIEDIKNGKFLFANRQSGAGTRLLFDYMLKKANVDSSEIMGYEKEFTTHLAVAIAVKNKVFDCGLAIKTVAQIMDLDFIPVGKEEYDFLVPIDSLEDIRVKKFIDIIKSKEFKNELENLGGYTYDNIGEVIIVDI